MDQLYKNISSDRKDKAEIHKQIVVEECRVQAQDQIRRVESHLKQIDDAILSYMDDMNQYGSVRTVWLNMIKARIIQIIAQEGVKVEQPEREPRSQLNPNPNKDQKDTGHLDLEVGDVTPP